jgi:hypothetical protein
MQRFRFLRFYVAGVVVIIALAIGAVSIIRSAVETRMPQVNTAEASTDKN